MIFIKDLNHQIKKWKLKMIKILIFNLKSIKLLIQKIFYLKMILILYQN